MAYQYYIKRNLVYKVYYPAFYTKRSLGVIYREYHLVNLKYKLPICLKKPCKSHTSRGRGKGLSRTAPPSTSSKMGGKKSGRGKRGNSSNTKSTRLVFT